CANAAEKEDLKRRFQGKVEFVDNALKDALLEYRSRCHDLGLTIRPRVFEEQAELELPIMDMSSSPSSASSPGESSKVTVTDIKYLRSQGGIKGVLEIHKVREEELQGYAHLWKTTEIWSLLKRQQAFHNWFSKLGDQCGFALAQAYRLELSVHFVRKQEYRGRSSAVASDRLRLNFDAVTTPGVLFMDSRPRPMY
ncbi:unnamed protein product, partial [Symbiodinium pilosum]